VQDAAPRRKTIFDYATFGQDVPTAAPAVAAEPEGEPTFGSALSDSVDQVVVSARALGAVLGKGDDPELASELARRISQPAKRSSGEKKLEEAAERMNKAEGFSDSAAALGDLLWTAVTEPRGTAMLVTRNVANSVPSIATSVAGGVGGAKVGAVAGPYGAVAGGLVGMATGAGAGSTITEMGAYVEGAVAKELGERKLPPTPENVGQILKDDAFRAQMQGEATRKGFTVGAFDAVTALVSGPIAAAPFRKQLMKAMTDVGIDINSKTAVRKEHNGKPALRPLDLGGRKPAAILTLEP
jgi:hypothetical protein